MFPAGSGCTGSPRLVQPGDEMIFGGESDENVKNDGEVEEVNQCVTTTPSLVLEQEVHSTARKFNLPLSADDLESLSHKNFAPETMKKVRWATKMFREWRMYRKSQGLEEILCGLDEKSTISPQSLIFALVRFITEVKKVDGSEFPPRTLYDIIVCVQFHLECIGLNWKIINDKSFSDVKLTLDNVMKLHTAQGYGKGVRKAQVLSTFDEDYLWSLGLLGSQGSRHNAQYNGFSHW